MPPGSTVTLTVSGDIAGESTFGVTILLEIVPAGGNTGTLEFTPALPVDITQLGDAWPGTGTFSGFDTDPAGTDSPTLNGVIDDSGASSAPVTFSGLLAGFPIVASSDATGVWNLVLSTSADDSSWEGLVTTLVAGTVTVSPSACTIDPDCDDLNPCTDDTCNAGTCQNANNTASCNDSDACTESDVCAGGTCAGSAINCSAFDDQCNTASCDPGGADGNCDTLTPANEGLACDDGQFCTTGETCTLGTCDGGSATDCSVATDQCNTGVCNETTDVCEAQPVLDGTPCDDTVPCTENDICTAGVCAGSAIDCSSLDDQCNTGVCNIGTGVCEAQPSNEGLACDDGQFCTTGEICTLGVCGGGSATDCSGVSDQCNSGVCNEATDACEPQPTNEGLACDDSQFCTTGETCTLGVCGGGSATDCSGAGDQCNNGVCNETTDACEPQPVLDGTACDDGLFCTTGESCTTGACGGGSATDCSGAADQCNTGVCNETTDACEAQPVLDGTACDNGQFCTTGETCTLGVCGGGSATDCSGAADQCNNGVCNETTDACEPQPANEGLACDDGQFCTTGETCTVGTCDGGSATDCSGATDQCNTGVCNEATDACEPQPANEGLACDDGQFCSTGETCTAGTCDGGSATDCSGASDQCNTGACNEATDACEPQPTNEGLACDDGLFCTTGETCTVGSCNGASATDCSGSSNQCNTGVCNEATDVCEPQPANEGLSCDDGDVCTEFDACSTGTCAGTSIGGCVNCTTNADCDDANTCTIDICAIEGTCIYFNNSDPCDDNDPCTELDTCSGGTCVGAPIGGCVNCTTAADCDDANACTNDICQVDGTCANFNNVSSCDDGAFCNGVDTCMAGVCVSAGDPCPPLTCDEIGDVCLPAATINGLELFYAGKFADAADPTIDFLAAGSTSVADNVSNYVRGITGIRVFFDSTITFATTPAAAFSFEWTTGLSTTFTPITDAATNVTVTALDSGGTTTVTIVITDDHVRKRWLKVTIDAAQITGNGVSLDGEMSGNAVVLPSGDGTPGGDAVFFVGNQPGDVDDSATTVLTDMGIIVAAANPFQSVPITNALDVDKSGKVSLADAGEARLDVDIFFQLPVISP